MENISLYFTFLGKIISSITRLRSGRTLIHVHSYKLFLHDSPICSCHTILSVWDIPHDFFDYPSISIECVNLSSTRFLLLIFPSILLLFSLINYLLYCLLPTSLFHHHFTILFIVYFFFFVFYCSLSLNRVLFLLLLFFYFAAYFNLFLFPCIY